MMCCNKGSEHGQLSPLKASQQSQQLQRGRADNIMTVMLSACAEISDDRDYSDALRKGLDDEDPDRSSA